jgi:hypothetical protein
MTATERWACRRPPIALYLLHSFWLIRFSQHIEFFGAIEATELPAVSEQMSPSTGAEPYRKH